MNKLLAALLCLSSFAFAQDAGTIMDKASAALGSKEAFDKIQTSLMQGRMVLPQGIEAKMMVFEKDGGKILIQMNAEAPGMSIEMRQGCDGTDCYSQDSFTGQRILEGQERESMLMQNGLKSHMNWRELYKSTELAGVEEVNGSKAYKINAVTQDGMTLANYYDTESYLLLRTDMKQQSVMGVVDMSIYFYDYKTNKDGIKYASRAESQAMGQNMNIYIDELSTNIPIPDEKFDLPTGLKN